MLEKHRIRCWIAPRDITPGSEWGAAIIQGMDVSKIMVLIFSGHANESAQVRREVERAVSKGLIVLPFRVEKINPAGAMEYALSKHTGSTASPSRWSGSSNCSPARSRRCWPRIEVEWLSRRL